MEKNKRNYKVRTLLSLMLISVLIGCVVFCCVGNTAEAATDKLSTDSEARGLVTTISLTVGSSNGEVWALAHNDFTLGFSTIQVYVELYSSLTYQDSYKDMTLESKNFIEDLNINKSLETSAPINGVQRYWRGRVNYKLDRKDWVSKESITYLVDVEGQVIR